MATNKTKLKHIAVAALAIMAAAITLSSCKKKSISMDTYSVNKSLHVKVAGVPDSVKTDMKLSVSLVFPEKFASDSIAGKIANDLLFEAFDDTTLIKLAPKDAVDKFAKEEMDGYLDEVKFASQKAREFASNGEKVPGFLLHNSELSIKAVVVNNDDNVLSIRIERSIYEGGAHPVPTIKLLTYDLKSGDRVMLEDIFTEGYEPLVRDEIVASIMKEKGFEAEEQMLMSGYFGIGTVEPTPNFLLKTDTITFLYNPYEIGTYALGYVEVPVALNAVKNVIKEDSEMMKALMKAKAEEKKEQSWK